jgi:hypothetical protein
MRQKEKDNGALPHLENEATSGLAPNFNVHVDKLVLSVGYRSHAHEQKGTQEMWGKLAGGASNDTSSELKQRTPEFCLYEASACAAMPLRRDAGLIEKNIGGRQDISGWRGTRLAGWLAAYRSSR